MKHPAIFWFMASTFLMGTVLMAPVLFGTNEDMVFVSFAFHMLGILTGIVWTTINRYDARMARLEDELSRRR